jgi:TDG/mug DNA glycosylase family protein
VPVTTLPDLLASGLDVVFVGINPSVYSAERGHYFARLSNKFWPCISRSTLSLAARTGLGVGRLTPEHDRALLDYGIGFTDAVKRPTPKASDLSAAELAAGVEDLLAKIERYRPRVACFHGVTGYRAVHRALTETASAIELGLQDVRVGGTQLFLVPNPSGANAHFTRDEQVAWYDALASFPAVVARTLAGVHDGAFGNDVAVGRNERVITGNELGDHALHPNRTRIDSK